MKKKTSKKMAKKTQRKSPKKNKKLIKKPAKRMAKKPAKKIVKKVTKKVVKRRAQPKPRRAQPKRALGRNPLEQSVPPTPIPVLIPVPQATTEELLEPADTGKPEASHEELEAVAEEAKELVADETLEEEELEEEELPEPLISSTEGDELLTK
jgi:hypothetical protein